MKNLLSPITLAALAYCVVIPPVKGGFSSSSPNPVVAYYYSTEHATIKRSLLIYSQSSQYTNPQKSSTALTALRIFSKRREDRVVQDPKTGFYRPAKSVKKAPPKPAVLLNNNDGPSAWDRTKEGLYNAVDGITSLPEKNPFATQAITTNAVFEGYSEVERRVLQDSNTQGALTQEYRKKNYIEGDDNVAPKRSLWRSVKGAVYSTVDVLASFISSSNKDEQDDTTIAADNNFKPVVRETILSSPPLQKAIATLESTNNPVEQILAKRTIQEYQQHLQDKETMKQQRQEIAETVKQTMFQLGDAVVETAEVMAQAPAKLSSTVQTVSSTVQTVSSSVQTIPTRIRQTVDTIRGIPTQVVASTQQIQSSVSDAIQTTQQTIEDIQAIPSKIQQSVEKTQSNVKNAVQTVEDVTTRAKVLVGLEKPVPKPPIIPPPKPLTAKDLGWKVVGGLTKGVAQVSWWAGKEAVKLSWKGATFAVQKLVEAYNGRQGDMPKPTLPNKPVAPISQDVPKILSPPIEKAPIVIEKNTFDLTPDARSNQAKAVMPTSVSSSTVEVESPLPTRSVSEKQAEIDRQVNQALKMAEEALSLSGGSLKEK